MLPNAYQQYQRVQTETASGGQLILLLYGGAIRFLGRADQARIKGDPAAVVDDIFRAQAIIGELAASLDHSVGGDVTKNLFDLYSYFSRRLTDAVVRRDEDAILEVINHLRELKVTWEEAVQMTGRKAISAA